VQFVNTENKLYQNKALARILVTPGTPVNLGGVGDSRIRKAIGETEYTRLVVGQERSPLIKVNSGNSTALAATHINARARTDNWSIIKQQIDSIQADLAACETPMLTVTLAYWQSSHRLRCRLLYFQNRRRVFLQRTFMLALLRHNAKMTPFLLRTITEASTNPCGNSVQNHQPESGVHVLGHLKGLRTLCAYYDLAWHKSVRRLFKLPSTPTRAVLFLKLRQFLPLCQGQREMLI